MSNKYSTLNCRKCSKPAYKVGGWVRTDKDLEWVSTIKCSILCSACDEDEYDLLHSLRYEHSDDTVKWVEYDSIEVIKLDDI